MRRFGLLIAVTGGLALSFDIPALRLGDGEAWSVLSLRATLVALVGLLGWRIANALGRTGPLVDGRMGAVVAALYGLNALTFLLAIHYTSVANVVFILALNPMATAVFSWWLIGERPARATVVSIALTVVGAGIIVADGVQSGGGFGDAMALSTTLLLALCLTLTRKHDLDVGFASLASAILPAVIGWVVVAFNGFSIAAPGWIALDGLVIMPIAFFCLAVAPRFVPAPVVAMAFLIETCLAPVWVWLIFAERPGQAALSGGALVLVAVVGHSVWQWRRGRRRPMAVPA